MNTSDPLAQARLAIQNGNLSRARAILESRLGDQERYAEIRKALAEVDLQLGDSSAALRAVQEILEKSPNDLPAHLLRARILQTQGKAREAIAILDRARQSSAASQSLLKFIAAEFVNLGAFSQAIATLQRIEPMDAQSFYHLGLSYYRLGQHGKALPVYRRLFSSIPDSPTIARELAQVAAEFREYPTAVEAYSRYMQLIQPSAQDYLRSADLHLMNHDVTKSQEDLDRAGSLGEDSAQYRLLRARLQRLRGEYTTSLESAFATITLDPLSASAWSIIAELTDAATMDKALIQQLAEVINSGDLPAPDREIALFALAELYTKAGNVESAYRQIQAANRIKEDLLSQEGRSYNRQAMESLLKTARHTFAGASDQTISPNPSRPVFIVGMPRSGTTVVNRLLEASGELHCIGETEAVPFIYAQLKKKFKGLPEDSIHQLTQDDWASLASEYVSRADAGERAIVDKMPHNFLYIGIILSMFPRARIVQMRRNAFDVCMSIFSKSFPGDHNYACNPRDLAHFYTCANKLMDLWSETYSNQVFDLDFDKFLDTPATSAKELFSFLGLRWHDTYLEPQPRGQAFTFSELQVRKPVSREVATKWHAFAPYASDLLEAIRAEVG